MNVLNYNIFMQGGTPCHRSKIVSEFLKEKNIKVLDWTGNSLDLNPGNSPDLNPIENLWEVLKNKVADKQPGSAKDLEDAIKEVWIRELSSPIAVHWLKVCQDVWRWLLKTMAVIRSTDSE